MPAGRDTNSNDAKSLRCRLFIGNLATERTSKREVEEMFAKFGEVVSCSLHNNFGFVQFDSEKAADDAVLAMHGTTLFDKRIDVNLAGVRRKPQSKDKYEGAPKKEEVVPENMIRANGPPTKNPPEPPYRSRSPTGARNDSYSRSLSPMSRYEELYRRDDPYGRDRYRHDDRPSYEYGRDFPPRDPYHFDRRDELPPPRYDVPPMDDPYRRPPPPRPLRPAIDCEIVSLFKEESRYAEEVEARLRSIGLVCNIGYPRDDVPIPEIIDRIARTGTLYAVVVTEQNAQHRSCTLNVLAGPRQEHRNMPLDDALSFVARNFDSYLRSLREPSYRPTPQPHTYPPRDDYGRAPPVQYAPPSSAGNLPMKPAEEKKLSNDELNEMIEKLRREKEEREAGKLETGAPPPRRDADDKLPPPSNVDGRAVSGYYGNYESSYR